MVSVEVSLYAETHQKHLFLNSASAMFTLMQSVHYIYEQLVIGCYVQGVTSSKNEGFSLTSGDFPTLGSEKDNSGKNADSEGIMLINFTI